MIKATPKDKELIVTILTDSFKENKSITYVVKNDSKQAWRIKKLMEYSFNLGISCGEIFISDNQKACTILLYPDKKPSILKRIIYDLDLAINCIGITDIFKVLKREKQIKFHHPKKDFLHL